LPIGRISDLGAKIPHGRIKTIGKKQRSPARGYRPRAEDCDNRMPTTSLTALSLCGGGIRGMIVNQNRHQKRFLVPR